MSASPEHLARLATRATTRGDNVTVRARCLNMLANIIVSVLISVIVCKQHFHNVVH